MYAEVADDTIVPDWKNIISLPDGEHSFVELLSLVRKAAASQRPISIAPSTGDRELSAADFLAKAALRQIRTDDEAETVYDLTDQDIRLTSVSTEGFRGSPNEITVDFTNRGKAVSAIIFGENGTGKSTIVDAVEFAAQGRVGRSSNFDSPLSPSLRSLPTKEMTPSSRLILSDGTTIERRLELSTSDHLVAMPSEVRPGFRLAPMTIKRSDILRFLDTDALERGTILLDYFPAEAGVLATRPEDQAHTVKGEIAELRIRRSGLSALLAPLLGVEEDLLESRQKFEGVVRQQIMHGMTARDFEESDGWKDVDSEIRSLVRQLYETFAHLNSAMKRYNELGNPFNPVLHKRQTRILENVLVDVGNQLSSAFLKIGTEYPVTSLDVVFAASGPLSLDMVVRLHDGTNCFPQQLFSEAYQDLIALLFFTSVAKAASQREQARVLIMDDILQSVDASIRHSFVSYLLSDFSDWQLIFTVHDRFWRDRLRDLLSGYEHEFSEINIRGWSFSEGPALAAYDSDAMTADLRLAISSAEPISIGLLAGKLLEEICNQLTWRIGIPIVRNRDDRYTLGNLWPVVHQRLLGTRADRSIRSLATQRGLRNVSAHAEAISLTLSSAEATDFAKSVLELYAHVRCSNCRGWIKGATAPSCTCQLLSL